MNIWSHQQGPSEEEDERDQKLHHHQHQQEQPHQHSLPSNQGYHHQPHFSFPQRYSYPYARYPHHANTFPVMYHQNNSFAAPQDTLPQQYIYFPGPGPGPGPTLPPAPPAARGPQYPIYQYYAPQLAAQQPLAPPRMKMKPVPHQPLPPTAQEQNVPAETQGFLHKCHLCSKSFKRRSWLKRHLLSHSLARHFACPWCLSKHKRKDNLLQHMKLKHTDHVLRELRLNDVQVSFDNSSSSANNNIRTLLYEGRLNKDDVKKVLNSLIDRHNQ